MRQYRDPEEISTASSIVDGPVKESSWAQKLMKKQSEQNGVGS